MSESSPIVVDFPLRGEWAVPHTPGDRVPSHGTDALGQRYAYDFIQTVGSTGLRFYRSSRLRYYTIGVFCADCCGYREPVYSPVNGTVVVACDGLREPRRIQPLADLLKVLGRSIAVSIRALFTSPTGIDLHPYIGNYCIIRFGDAYAFFAHLSPGTMGLREGQRVSIGDRIGLVGHTGNSTAPHLHFHLMDSPDVMTARGLPCAFKNVDVLEGGVWKSVDSCIPAGHQRIRPRC